MVKIYKKTKEKKENINNGWMYWGLFKNKNEESHVWYKYVTEEEALMYELEKGILN